MHFGENQLSRSLIGLSPLSTGHPPGFQPWWVRSSTRSYPRFNLPMDRSLRFGSIACDSNALFRLAFATATPHGLTLPHTVTRRLILQKARGHFTSARRLNTLPRLVGTRFQVLFHDPSPGHFSPFPHGTCSLSVTREYLGLGGGPPKFTRDFTGPVLLGIPLGSRSGFAYRGITFCADAFLTSSATHAISYSLPDQQLRLSGPATPITQRLPAITRGRFGLFPFRSPLLRESRLLSLPVGTEMFHFPTFPPPALCVQAGAMGHYTRQVSPFGNPRIEVWLPTPRGLSQAPTSFFGSWYQGIHRVPLLTWQLQMMLASTVQFSRYGRYPPSTASWRGRFGPIEVTAM